MRRAKIAAMAAILLLASCGGGKQANVHYESQHSVYHLKAKSAKETDGRIEIITLEGDRVTFPSARTVVFYCDKCPICGIAL